MTSLNLPSIIVVVFFSVCLFGQSESMSNALEEPSILIKNANYVDVEKGSIVSNKDILISQGQITRIGDNLDIPQNCYVKEDPNQWIIPGLIDAHIHLFQSGGLYTRPDALDLRDIKPYHEEVEWLTKNAGSILQSYLKLGITTVVDVGGPMSNYLIRDEYEDSNVHPNLFLTGPLISTYEPAELITNDSPIIRVTNEDEARELVKKQVPFSPDFIKIWYITLPTMTASSTYDIVSAAIDESHQHNLEVAVHATQLNTAKLALKAGADILVHSVANPIDDEFINMLLESGVTYIPTLSVHANYDLAFSSAMSYTSSDFNIVDPIVTASLIEAEYLDHPNLNEARKYAGPMLDVVRKQDDIRRSNLKKVIDAGVNVATGTDAGNIGTLHASSFEKEIIEMMKAGISNADILKASTIAAAKALRKHQSLGSIEEGKRADLIILNRNPMSDLSALFDIEYVIKDGHLLNPKTLLQDTPEQLVQRQLNGYNSRDIEAFLYPYSDSVKVFGFPDQFYYQGKETMRTNYSSMFDNTPDLHCKLVNRMILGNTIIDQELVTGIPNQKDIKAIAIYKIRHGKIQEVYFDDGR